MLSGPEAAMETSELALGSASGSFVLEKVLQEVQEVESREHRPEPAAAAEAEAEAEAASDLKFQPGFVHLLKGRFALLSRGDRPPGGGLDPASEAPRRGLASARHLSRSSDALDGPTPRRGRANGWVPRDDLQDALAEDRGQRARPSPASIHLFARAADVPAKERRRGPGSKIIIIEAAGDQTAPPKKAPAPPAPAERQEAAATPPPAKEAWPTPNIVASTRTLFEASAAFRRPAPKAPPPKASGDGPGPVTVRSPLLRRESAPAAPDKAAPEPEPERAEAEPVVSVSEARRLFDRQGAAPRPRAPESPKRQAPRPESSPVKATAPTAPFVKTTAAPTISPLKSSSPSVSSARSITLSISSTKSTSPAVSPVKSTASVSPVRSTVPAVSPSKSTAPIVSPVRSTAPAVSPAKSTAPIVSPVRSTAPAVSPVKSTAPIVSPVRSTALVKSASPAPAKPNTAAVLPVRSSGPVNGDPASWHSWEDIPKPQQRTFVSEARRVDISKEQLTASRAKSKSFFFTAADTAAVELPDTQDRTITFKVAPEQRKAVAEPLNPRLAEQTFWDSYRKEEEEEEAGFADPELMEEYRKLMAQAREEELEELEEEEEEEEEEELEPLPSTNIDDVPDLDKARPVAVTRSSQKAEERKKKRLKQRLQFAEPDQLTTTHEYPSERAMIEDLGISPDFDLDTAGELSLDDPSAFFGLDENEEEVDGGGNSNRLLAGSSGIGSGSLASYKSKYTGQDFAWGESEPPNGRGGVTAAAAAAAANAEEEEEVAEPDSLDEEPHMEELAWSSSASADLLF